MPTEVNEYFHAFKNNFYHDIDIEIPYQPLAILSPEIAYQLVKKSQVQPTFPIEKIIEEYKEKNDREGFYIDAFRSFEMLQKVSI